MAVKPVIYGESQRPPRGDYSRAREDYTCVQNHAAYSAADHDIYRRLYERQAALLPGLACQAFIDALPKLGASTAIPRFEDINERLIKTTGWQLVGVPGLIPEVPFFTLLANRKFPVTDWIRTPAEFDYIVEPDIFHDLFGHVPLLFDARYADHIQAYGQGALKAHALEHGPQPLRGAVEMLSRLYWYTIEFGLLQENGQPRAYGAGILSSPGELVYSVQSAQPQRTALRSTADLLRCMAAHYKIDSYQQQYFVIDSFEALLALTTPDFTPLYQSLADDADRSAAAQS
ncbi:Phenylalanine 4-hydroxylase [Polaromonas sp. OV174]|uniref:phenylalanine 4-monooxygenase n=1 Tax=Polaromonas sp. OV174 TaxID=1855300 RepID=UPI0008DF658F|nr:phenylalanine 4-monooxygenase [Polaromonas sp. OV174]SFB92389.1 Phenylalanine 4-hydroxylase [Polaromonas sp. OV174]